MATIEIPESLKVYYENKAVRRAVDELVRKLDGAGMPDCDWEEAQNYNRALLMAAQVRADYMALLFDVWEATFGRSKPQRLGDQYFGHEYLSPKLVWEYEWLWRSYYVDRVNASTSKRLLRRQPNGWIAHQGAGRIATQFIHTQRVIVAHRSSLATLSISADDPKAVPLSGMVSVLPLRRDHRPGAYLDDQVADREASFLGHPHEIAVRPLGSMAIHHVSDLRQQQAARLQHPFRLLQKGGG
ncbi:MAG: hypothetical protein OXP11_03855 [Gammaproteobacteria bacterium]|nr:hypothetical protein [Gammaproteobacteria bacterium]